MLSSEVDVPSSVVVAECYSKKQNCISVTIGPIYSERVSVPLDPEKTAEFGANTHTNHVASSGKDQPVANKALSAM